MVAACKHIRYLPARTPEDACIAGIRGHPRARTIHRRCFENLPGRRAPTGQRRRSRPWPRLPPRRGKVADREQLWLEDLDDPLVESLVPAAEQDQARLSGQLDNPALVESGPRGREDNQGAGGLIWARTASAAATTGGAMRIMPGPPQTAGRPLARVCLEPSRAGPTALWPPGSRPSLAGRDFDSGAVEEGWKKSQHIDAERRQGHGGPYPLRRAVAWPPRALRGRLGHCAAAGSGDRQGLPVPVFSPRAS